jgi:translation initiation factor IF-1
VGQGENVAKDDLANLEGTVTEGRGGGNFVVRLESGQTVTAKLGGAMRRFRIRVIVGDRVTVGVSPYDPTHGLILYRHKA